jgi:manganese/zinc/iron transport system substrate-binding protein
LTNVVEIVGGEHVNVTGLMGPGVDPHLYVASESDVESLQSADVIIYNGLFLEAQMAEVFEALAERKTVLAAGETIDPARLLPWASYADEFDPHIWFDVTLWMEVVRAVRDTLSTADEANAAAYAANADALIQELEELHAYVQAQAERVPAEQRVLVTAHDAFHYFGHTYGFDVRGLQGISTAAEAGTADVQQLADFIVTQEIPAIFIESSVPIRNVEALQAAVAAKGHEVVIGGELFSDAMGDPGTPEGTYVGMVRHNIDTIVTALLGE